MTAAFNDGYLSVFLKVGCLLSKYCMVYEIKPSKVMNEIIAASTDFKSEIESKNVVSVLSYLAISIFCNIIVIS